MDLVSDARAATRLRHKYDLVQIAIALGVIAVLLGLATAALAAGDAGEHTFFREQSGGDAPVADAQPAPTYAPLTIRKSVARGAFQPRQRREQPVADRGRTPRIAGLPAPTKGSALGAEKGAPRPTLYTDRTLRQGDVVMLKQGLRVFAGSRQFPYADKDFVTLDKAQSLKRQFTGQLQAIADNQERH